MPFGEIVGSIRNLKKGLTSKAGPITFIPKEKDGPIMVRFLQEPDQWAKYQEVWDETSQRGYPVPEQGEPGYPMEGDRISIRYLSNAVDIEKDKAIVVQIPKSLCNQLYVRYERYGTLLDRDYELFKVGSGMDTDYGQSPEPVKKRNVAKYDQRDLLEVLEEAYNIVWGDAGDDEEDDTPAPARKATKATKKASARIQEEEDEPDLDALGQLADVNDDATAQAKLTELADAQGIDTDAYPTWVEVAAALTGEAESEEDEGEETEDAEGEDDAIDYETLGADADEGDQDAAGQLADAAETAGLDPDEYGTWAELAAALAEEGPGDDELTAKDLEALTTAELRTTARGMGHVTRGLDRDALIEAILGGPAS